MPATLELIDVIELKYMLRELIGLRIQTEADLTEIKLISAEVSAKVNITCESLPSQVNYEVATLMGYLISTTAEIAYASYTHDLSRVRAALSRLEKQAAKVSEMLCC